MDPQTQKAQRRIPQVHLSDLKVGPAERNRFIRTLGDALREFGFVSVVDHGVDNGLIRRTYADVEAFFALSEERKGRYQVPGGSGQRGYTGFGQEHAKNRTIGDLKEFWHVARELPPEHPRLAKVGGNVWPEEVPSFRGNTLALFRALDGVAAELLGAIGAYLGVERERLPAMAADGNSILRLIRYPPLKESFIPGAVRSAEHEDINLITLLCEGTTSGLEILTRDGEWIPVDTSPGQIVVDTGDMLSRITNGELPATTHRVVNPPSAAEDGVRYSMPFFVHPYPDCLLQVLPQTVHSDRPARFPPITADAFLAERLQEIGLAQALSPASPRR